MDLSKAFDTINQDLLIAKLHTDGFSNDSFKLLYSYLNNRWHRTRISQKFISLKELSQGVPQGSVLRPFLFNIYLNDLFFLLMCVILLMKTFIESQFGYCPLIWMFHSVNTRRYSLTSLSYFAPKVWDMVPSEIKNVNSLQKFKIEIRKWTPENYSCYLCRPYTQNIGFVGLV